MLNLSQSEHKFSENTTDQGPGLFADNNNRDDRKEKNQGQLLDGDRNSSVGSVLGSLSCMMQNHRFDPPLSLW